MEQSLQIDLKHYNKRMKIVLAISFIIALTCFDFLHIELAI